MEYELPNHAEIAELDKKHEYIAHQISREDNLVNVRMTWNIQLNGFLFAALALAVNETPTNFQGVFAVLLPSIGIATTLSGVLGVYAAGAQLKLLKEIWLAGQYADRPRPFGDALTHGLGQAAAYLPLLALLVAWAALLLHALRSHTPAA